MVLLILISFCAVIMTLADKPKWYSTNRPFRKVLTDGGSVGKIDWPKYVSRSVVVGSHFLFDVCFLVPSPLSLPSSCILVFSSRVFLIFVVLQSERV